MLTRAPDPDKDFSLAHYREILEAIKSSHKNLTFRDAHALGRDILEIEKFVIMRHDVEFSIPAALRLARIEHEHGIRSTFFLLQTSDYNPFEEDEAVQIREILKLGHDIGLHYDAALFERLELDPVRTARAQIDLFEAFFETKIHAMSSHMPMRSGKTFSIEGIIDTYDPLYLRDIKYLSDSTQAWREGVVTKSLERHNHIHLLTHEYIWHPDGWNWETLLLVEAQEKFQRMWNRACVNINTYRRGLSMRAQKDAEFKRRFLTANEGVPGAETAGGKK